MTKLSCKIKSTFFPIMENWVASIPDISKGIRIGKDNIGNNAPLTFAFATIAPIMVEHPAIPIPETNIVKTNKWKKLTFTISKKIKNINIEVKLTKKETTRLKINFPKNTE